MNHYPMRKEVKSRVRIPVSGEQVYAYFFSIDLLQIFEGFWFIPNIESPFFALEEAKQDSEMLIYFADGSTATCQLFDFVMPMSFSVHVDQFTSSRFKGLEAMRCQFFMSDSGSGRTHVNTRYQFKMKSPFWNLLFEVFMHRFIQKRLNEFLNASAKELMVFRDWQLRRT